MTQGVGVVRLVIKRWYLFLAGFLVAAVGIHLASNAQRIYTAELDVTFDPPDKVIYNEDWVDYTETLIAYSEVVDAAFAEVRESITLSSPQATLYGNGVREGISVDLKTTGNQWVEQLDRPVITIKVSSSDQAFTVSTTTDLAQQIASLSDQLQADAGVPADERITAEWSDQEFALGTFGSSRFSQVKGAAVVMSAALLVAFLVASLTVRPVGRHRASTPAI